MKRVLNVRRNAPKAVGTKPGSPHEEFALTQPIIWLTLMSLNLSAKQLEALLNLVLPAFKDLGEDQPQIAQAMLQNAGLQIRNNLQSRGKDNPYLFVGIKEHYRLLRQEGLNEADALAVWPMLSTILFCHGEALLAGSEVEIEHGNGMVEKLSL